MQAVYNGVNAILRRCSSVGEAEDAAQNLTLYRNYREILVKGFKKPTLSSPQFWGDITSENLENKRSTVTK